MKQYATGIAVAMIAGISGWGLASGSFSVRSAHAQAAYSVESVKGTYGYTIESGAGKAAPQVGVGLLVADGNGGLSGSESVQTYGTGNEARTFQGSYTVNADGTGTMTLNYAAPAANPAVSDEEDTATFTPPALSVTYQFVLVNNKAEIRGIRSENGALTKADFKLQ